MRSGDFHLTTDVVERRGEAPDSAPTIVSIIYALLSNCYFAPAVRLGFHSAEQEIFCPGIFEKDVAAPYSSGQQDPICLLD